MFDSIKIAWMNLEAVGYHPLIALFGVGMYFVMRGMLGRSKGEALLSVLLVNILGQVYYDPPATIDAIAGTLFFAVGQAVVAFGVYSALEWAWRHEFIQAWLKKRFGGKEQTP